MAAGKHNFEIEQGETWERTVTIEDEDSGDPWNLTGYTARMKIKDRYTGEEYEELTSVAGDIVITALTGILTITITAIATAAYTFTDAIYDLELVSGVTVTKVLKGKITLMPEVTD